MLLRSACRGALLLGLLAYAAGAPGQQVTTVPALQQRQAPSSAPAAPPTTAPTTAGAVAVYINGEPIYDKVIDELVASRLPTDLSPAQLESLFRQWRPQVLEDQINDRLLDLEIARAGVELSDANARQMVEEEWRGFLSIRGMTRAEFEDSLKTERKQTVEQFLAERAADPVQRQGMLRRFFITRTFPDAVNVSDAEVEQYHTERRERRFLRPEMVQASQILIRAEGKTIDQRAALRKRAEQILREVREPGADFESLAARYSDDSATRDVGGSLGWFPAEGALDPAVAKAAFALQDGEVSGIVESTEGYHILKQTGRQPQRRIDLDEAREGIRLVLLDTKIRSKRAELSKELRQKYTVAYPPGKEPASQPSGPRPIVTPLK